jgi:large subunit ribosomal protein L21|uniref:Large ribosomal subunit protein bL21 n=1 Tax=candidate division WOR-3 bacterium TaxID=2052148 RepID=A0A7C6EAQ4_UNCW3
MYAVVQFGGAQFIVKPGEKVTIPKVKAEVGETIKITDVLFVKKDGETIIGKPKIPEAFVEAKVLANTKGKKVTVFKFIRRENYRRKKGHRQPLSELEILKINLP